MINELSLRNLCKRLIETKEFERMRLESLSEYSKITKSGSDNEDVPKNLDMKPDLRIDILDERQQQKISAKLNGETDVVLHEFDSYGSMPKNFSYLIRNSKQQSGHAKLNRAFTQQILVVELNKSSREKKNCNLNLVLPKGNSFCTLALLAEAHSNFEVTLKLSSLENTGVSFLNFLVFADNNSQIKICTFQELHPSTIFYEHKSAYIGSEASVDFVDVACGAAFACSRIESWLGEQRASSKIRMLFHAAQDQKYDITTSTMHVAGNTSSDIITKGAVMGNSKVLARGTINIADGAAGSKGYEKQDALILNKEAQAFAVPKLVINNSDVKCSHGSVVGKLDEQKIFYAMSKGIAEDDAKKLLVEGYFNSFMSFLEEDQKIEAEKILSKKWSMKH